MAYRMGMVKSWPVWRTKSPPAGDLHFEFRRVAPQKLCDAPRDPEAVSMRDRRRGSAFGVRSSKARRPWRCWGGACSEAIAGAQFCTHILHYHMQSTHGAMRRVAGQRRRAHLSYLLVRTIARCSLQYVATVLFCQGSDPISITCPAFVGVHAASTRFLELIAVAEIMLQPTHLVFLGVAGSSAVTNVGREIACCHAGDARISIDDGSTAATATSRPVHVGVCAAPTSPVSHSTPQLRHSISLPHDGPPDTGRAEMLQQGNAEQHCRRPTEARLANLGFQRRWAVRPLHRYLG